MRRVAIVTLGRSDLSSCLPVAHGIAADPALELALVVGGTHLAEAFGHTVEDVEREGLPIAERVGGAPVSDEPRALAEAAAEAQAGLAGAYERLRPDLVLVVGDRVELLAAAAAALPFRLPLAHVSGGDVTEGAVDNAVRYAVSALSHLHFVAMPAHAERLARLGEERWRIHVSGDPALDLALAVEPLGRDELAAQLGLALEPPLVVLTYHPATLAPGVEGLDEVLRGLERVGGTVVATYPSADPDHAAVVARLEAFAAARPGVRLVPSLGQRVYYGLLRHADVMVGNSSSGIWEAPSFALPVVNVGDRQRGRVRAANVVDVAEDADAVEAGARTVLEPGFRAALAGLENPYGDGRATERILAVLREVELGPRLLGKRFGVEAGADG